MSALRKYQTQFRLAKASLLNAPAFSLAVISTLALTLTTLFVVFSLINVYFFKPLDVEHEDRLVVIEFNTSYGENTSSGYQNYPGIDHLYRTESSFESKFMVNTNEFVFRNLPGEPRVDIMHATNQFFTTMRVPLVAGEHLPAELETDGSYDGVLISERFWNRYFNGDADAIGQRLEVSDNIIYTIKGVVSEDYSNPYLLKEGQVDVWLPMTEETRFYSGDFQSPWGQYYRFLKIIGVKKAGLSNDDVKRDLDQLFQDIKAEWREKEPDLTGLTTNITSYREAELGGKDHLSLFMFAGTCALVLIALVNVSNLFFSRAIAQHRNLALQAILGAKRKTLFSSLFIQALLLVTVSMVLSLFISAWGIKLFKYLADGHLPLVQSVGIDSTLVLVAVVINIALAFVFAGLNSKLIDYSALHSQVQASGKGGAKQISGTTVKVLIGAQMLLATVVVICSQMALSKSMESLNRPLGANVDNMLNVGAFIPRSRDAMSPQEAIEVRQQLIEKILAQPEVVDVAIGTSPVQKQRYRQAISDLQDHTFEFIPGIWVGQRFFDIAGIKIIEGRTFSDATMRGEAHEMLMSKSAAAKLSPNESIIGKQYEGLNDQIFEVVGVTEDFRHPLYYEQDQGRHFWWPQFAYSHALMIEFKPGETWTQEHILDLYRQVHPRMSLWMTLDIEQEYKRLIYLDVVTFWVCISLAIFTLVLASVGIYGVLSYNLQARRFEFGIKMAVGAKAAHLYKIVAKETLLPLVVGMLIATVLAIAVFQGLNSTLSLWLSLNWLYVSFGIAFTLVIALLSGFKPLHKAIQSDPMKALRSE